MRQERDECKSDIGKLIQENDDLKSELQNTVEKTNMKIMETQELSSKLSLFQRDMTMLSDEKSSKQTEIQILRQKYHQVLEELNEKKDYESWITNTINSCVGIIGSYVQGIEKENLILGRFGQYKNLTVVNGNLLDIVSRVSDFLRDLVSECKNWGVEDSEEDYYENSGRVEPYRAPNL